MTGATRQLVRDTVPAYRRLQHMLRGIADTIRPPERLTVTEAAEKPQDLAIE